MLIFDHFIYLYTCIYAGTGTLLRSAGAGNYGIRGGPYVGACRGGPFVGIFGGLGLGRQGPGIQMTVDIILLPPAARKHMESGSRPSLCAL